MDNAIYGTDNAVKCMDNTIYGRYCWKRQPSQSDPLALRRYCTPNVRHDREFLPECDDPFGCLPEALVIFPVYACPARPRLAAEPTLRRRCGSAEALRSTRALPRPARPRLLLWRIT